jgi:hypothetical protein
MVATGTSQNALIPTTGTPTLVIVANMGERPAFVQLGTAGVVASPSGPSAIVFLEKTMTLSLGANTYIAALGAGPLDLLFGT